MQNTVFCFSKIYYRTKTNNYWINKVDIFDVIYYRIISLGLGYKFSYKHSIWLIMHTLFIFLHGMRT